MTKHQKLTQEEAALFREYLAEKVVGMVQIEAKKWLKENIGVEEVTNEYFVTTSESTITAISMALMSFMISLLLMGVTDKEAIKGYLEWLTVETFESIDELESGGFEGIPNGATID